MDKLKNMEPKRLGVVAAAITVVLGAIVFFSVTADIKELAIILVVVQAIWVFFIVAVIMGGNTESYL